MNQSVDELLPLSLDELLTTTRTVRKRLDLTRPVPRELVAYLAQHIHEVPVLVVPTTRGRTICCPTASHQ